MQVTEQPELLINTRSASVAFASATALASFECALAASGVPHMV